MNTDLYIVILDLVVLLFAMLAVAALGVACFFVILDLIAGSQSDLTRGDE